MCVCVCVKYQWTGEAKTEAGPLGESNKWEGDQRSGAVWEVNSARAGSQFPHSKLQAGGWEQILHTLGSDISQLYPVLPCPTWDTHP